MTEERYFELEENEMVRLIDHGVVLTENGNFIKAEIVEKDEGKTKTMAYGILKAHNHSGNMEQLQLKFDAWYLRIITM